MIALALDASTYAGTVCVLRDGAVTGLRETAMRGADEERLLPAVAEALAEAGIAPRELEGVFCGGGPGSFTSLRIAASIAKGIATATGTPLVAVPSLALLVAACDATRHAGRYVAALDALRGEHYVATIEVGAGAQVTAVGRVERCPSQALARHAQAIGPLVGPGLAIDAAPSVAGMPRLREYVASLEPVSLATWEPEYGRLAEAQVKWEAAHGRPLPAA